MAICSALEIFDGSNDWKTYIIKLCRFFATAEITDDKEKAMFLLSTLSQDVVDVLKTMCAPKTCEQHTFMQMCALMQRKYAPDVSTMFAACAYAEVRNFFNAKQKQNESVKNWLDRVKELANFCPFGEHLQEEIKDRFVSGLYRSSAIRRMYAIGKTISLDEFVNAAIQQETENTRKRAKYEPKIITGVRRCFACHRTNHPFKECIKKYANYKCRFCGNKGHLTRACLIKKATQKE